MWGGVTTQQQLRESISRLWRLDMVPQGPEENPLAYRRDPQRLLSIAREKEIVSNLAFLSATSDDSLKVMAICVEERADGRGATVRVASNTGDLTSVTSGLRMLAKILERAARRENTRAEDQTAFLHKAVSLDSPRILSRLRSRHARRSQKTAGKPALIRQLSEVLEDNSIRARRGFSQTSLTDLRSRAHALQVSFARLEGISSPFARPAEMREALEVIVQKAHELTMAVDLNVALQGFSGDPSLRKHLPEAIGKLSRYYSVSSELVCAARDKTCGIFQNIQVEPYQITVPASIGHTGCKVYAEIQLLFFYEAYPNHPRPRIICSSKSACYLCNLFFRLHGGFHVPRTHGRLYDKWILPDWLEVPLERHHDLAMVARSLKATVDAKLRIASRAKRRPCNHPNESILLLSAHWPSSSALSTNLVPLSPTPPPTVRPRSLAQDVPGRKPSSRAEPTASWLPLEASRVANTYTQAPSVNPRVNRPVVDTVFLGGIGQNNLPYRQTITVSTPLLHLQLDEVSLLVEFDIGVRGHLLVTHPGEATEGSKRYYTAEIEDILTASELQVECPHGSEELTVRFQHWRRGIICIVFVWERPSEFEQPEMITS